MSKRGDALGRHCEEMAVRFLKGKRYEILERNYRTPFGEIDVIAEDKGCIVFIEVKSRSSPLFGPPYLRVTKKKKEKIIKSALSYQKKYGLIDKDSRIDVISVSLDLKESIELIKGAFGAEGWGH